MHWKSSAKKVTHPSTIFALKGLILGDLNGIQVKGLGIKPARNVQNTYIEIVTENHCIRLDDNGMVSEACDSGKTHSLVPAGVAAPH